MATIPTSTAPAARTWLYDQFTAQIAPDPGSPQSSLLICYDDVGTNAPDDVVIVGAVTRAIGVNSMVGGGGVGWLDERYTVTVTIDVFRGGDDAAAVFTRACLLLDQVCAIVRTDPTLGGTVLTGRPSTSQAEGEWDDEHMGRHMLITVDVECYARI